MQAAQRPCRSLTRGRFMPKSGRSIGIALCYDSGRI